MCLQMYVAVKFFFFGLVLCIIIHVEWAGGGGGGGGAGRGGGGERLTVSSLLFSSNLVRGVHVHASSEPRETRRSKETARTARAVD